MASKKSGESQPVRARRPAAAARARSRFPPHFYHTPPPPDPPSSTLSHCIGTLYRQAHFKDDTSVPATEFQELVREGANR